MNQENENEKVEDKQVTPSTSEPSNVADEQQTQNPANDESNNHKEPFDWESYETKGFGEGYTKKQIDEMSSIYEKTLTTVNEKDVVEATVVGINAKDVILNIGFKSDGLVSTAEFRDNPDLKIGDTVEVFIEEQENLNGQLVLSRRKAKIVKAWENIQKALDEDLIIEGYIKRRTKGGLIMDIYGVEAFLPGSQIDVKPIRDFDVFVNKTMEVKVLKINYTNDNVVISHKVLIEKDIEKQKAEILNNLEKGQILEGTIKNMTHFGVFIDLGGVDGLLHITDISWGRINHPDEILKLDETVKVVVLDFDENKKRISLGMKQLTSHPWDSLEKDLDVGSKVKGKIVNVADYGAFLELHPGVEGLIHVSEMSWSQHLRNPQDFINVGDELDAVILTLERENRKMSLGIKQLTEDPWTKQEILSKYGVGTTHKGLVRNLTGFGLFLELEAGIDGLVHVSDLSWTKKVKHPSEFVKVGEELEVMVLELDVENRRLALSHKHLEENPWDTFESVFKLGTDHKCTITLLTDKSATLELPYGIEGYCTSKNLVKEDGSVPKVGETINFRVLEFSKDDKKIALSHKATYQKEEKKKSPASAKKEKVKLKEIEKSTLGDIDVLSALKDKMEDTKKPNLKKTVSKNTAKQEVEKKTEVVSKEVVSKKEENKELALEKTNKEAEKPKKAVTKKSSVTKNDVTKKTDETKKPKATAKKKPASDKVTEKKKKKEDNDTVEKDAEEKKEK